MKKTYSYLYAVMPFLMFFRTYSKRIMLFTALVTLSNNYCYSQNLKALDAKKGFQKFYFNESKMKYLFYDLVNSGSKKIKGIEEITYKVNKKDYNPHLDDIFIDKLEIVFFDGELYKIVLSFDGGGSGDRLLNSLTSKYGTPKFKARSETPVTEAVYTWKGQIVELNFCDPVYTGFASGAYTFTGNFNYSYTVTYIYLPIYNKITQLQSDGLKDL